MTYIVLLGGTLRLTQSINHRETKFGGENSLLTIVNNIWPYLGNDAI